MSVETKVTCDQCGSDLTSTGNCEDWRLALTCEAIPSEGGFVTAMHIPKPIRRAHHFCGMHCLTAWVRVRPNDAASSLPGVPDGGIAGSGLMYQGG